MICDFRRRSRAVPPQPTSMAMDILHPSIGHATNKCIIGRKMILMKLRPLSFDLWRRWYFLVVYQHRPHRSHQRCHCHDDGDSCQFLSNQSAHTIECIIGRTMALTTLPPLSSIVVSVVRSVGKRAAAMIVCASTSPPIEDWGECTIGGMGRDRKVLLLIVRLYLTPTSLHLYTAWQGYNHRRNMMYNLCISYKR